MTRPRGEVGDRGTAALWLLAVPALLASVLVLLVAGVAGSAASAPPVCGAAAGAANLTREQAGNAAVIVRVVRERRLPAYAAVVAVATAYQESRLRNLTYGDAAGPDSAGLFQQRPSAGWGTRAQVLDPGYATGAFLDRLVTVPRWQSVPLTTAAQAVQNSTHPRAYARWESLANTVVPQLWPGGTTTCPDPAGAGGSTAGTTKLPAGFVVTGTPAARRAVLYALAQLGKPYLWGAAGPAAFDCSGLTMAAWAQAGVRLPHFTGAQVEAGSATSTDLSRSAGGDLVFIPGSRGTPTNPRHVGMIAGHVPVPGGSPRIYLIQAPQTGMPVTLTDTTDWAAKVVAVRHIG